jgi:hypothetical protein
VGYRGPIPNTSDAQNIQRCREEVADIERLLRAGHPDLQGLCLALADWSLESRLIQRELGLRARKPASACGRAGEGAGGECYFAIE